MARKIKTPLKMKDGTLVHTIKELHEHFDIESIIECFLDGRLERWLDSHYEEKKAKVVHELEATDDDLPAKLCATLSIELPPDETVDVTTVAKTLAKKQQLRMMTQDETILSHAGQTAFTQDELQELLSKGDTTIYLCGKSFSISQNHDNMTYVGILGKPVADIGTASATDLQTHHILLQDVQIKSTANLVIAPDEQLETAPEAPEHQPLSSLRPNLPNHKKVLSYSGKSFLHSLSSASLDTMRAKELFDCLTAKLQPMAFDVDASSRPLLTVIHDMHKRFDIDASSRPLLDIIHDKHHFFDVDASSRPLLDVIKAHLSR